MRKNLIAVFSLLAALAVFLTAPDVSAGRARVGVCLAANDTLAPQPKEDEASLYERTWNALIDIANAFVASSPAKSAFEFSIANARESSGGLPSPDKCEDFVKDGFDTWIAVYLTDSRTFAFEVFQRKSGDLVAVATDEGKRYDQAAAKGALTSLGSKLATNASPPPVVSIEDVAALEMGVIVLIDDSGSMTNQPGVTTGADPGHVNRLAMAPTIVEMLDSVAAPNIARPIPFAFVLFADEARALENAPGQPFFTTTRADLARARALLGQSLRDDGGTNLEAGIRQAEKLMLMKKGIKSWHIVLITDGVPTVGMQDGAQLAAAAEKAFNGKGTLSSVALYGEAPGQTEEGKLLAMVGAVIDGAGRRGEVVKVHVGDSSESMRKGVDSIAYLIGGSTLRSEVTLACTRVANGSAFVCKLDPNRPFRFGAVRDRVTFVADSTAFGTGGKCEMTIGNKTFRDRPVSLSLRSGEPSAKSIDQELTVELVRTPDRVLITLTNNGSTVIKGDWDIELQLDLEEIAP